MDIDIKSNNLWIALYYGFYGKYPKTWCGLFWSLFLGILLLLFSPIVLIGVTIARLRDKKYDFNQITTMCIVHFFIILLSLFLGGLWIPDGNGFSWWYFFLGFCTLIVICIAAILLFASVYYIDEYIAEWKEAKEVLNRDKPPKEPNVLWESIKAIKSKVCPRINIIFDEELDK